MNLSYIVLLASGRAVRAMAHSHEQSLTTHGTEIAPVNADGLKLARGDNPFLLRQLDGSLPKRRPLFAQCCGAFSRPTAAISPSLVDFG